MRFLLTVALLAALAGNLGCTKPAEVPTAEVGAEHRRRTVAPVELERSQSPGSDAVYAPNRRLVYALDPPLPAAEPERCAVGEEIRPAMGCLESFPLSSTSVARPGESALKIEGNVPRRLWGQPVLIVPRVRGDVVEGFKPTSAQLVEGGFLGFDFETRLPPLGGKGDLEVQLRAYITPPNPREFLTEPIKIGPGDFLSFGLAMSGLGRPFANGTIEFRVSALSADGEEELFSEGLTPGVWTGSWLDRRVPLEELEGQSVRFRFRSVVTTKDGSTPIGFPLWGNPEIFQTTVRGARRNLILISLDTWRWDHFGGSISGGPITPELEKLAKTGAVFEQAISTYPSTSASHMSLFTGLYPITHQVRFADDVVGNRVPTLAEILAAHGYQTGAVTENAMLSAGAGFSFGFDSYLENKGLGMWSTEGQLDSTLQKARRWLDRHQDDRFFLFLHTYQIHSPYEPRDEDVFPLTEDDRFEREGGVPRWVTELRYRYAGEIRYADRALARFLRELGDRGIGDETIVVLTSDHGEEFAEHDQIGHSKSAYEESLRIPLLVWAPGLIDPGLRISDQVSLVDVVPTLLDLLDINLASELQGESLRPALEGRKLPGRDVRYAESPDIFNRGKRLVAVRSQNYKWIAPFDSMEVSQVYDLETDPAEKRNILDEELAEIGQAHLRRYKSLEAAASPKRELDAQTTEKLRALGYLDSGPESH